MKKKLAVLVCGIGVAGMVLGATAATLVRKIQAELRYDFEVVVDGEVKQFKNAQGENVYPVLYDGTTYLPVRAIGELMGKKVYWYEDEKRIELRDFESTVTDADVIVPGNDDKDGPIYELPVEEPSYEVQSLLQRPSNVEITEGIDKAKCLALKKAGFAENQVTNLNVELDEERGIYYYDVEFKKDGKEYDAKYRADNFELAYWYVEPDDDIVEKEPGEIENDELSRGLAKAKKLALEKAGFTESQVKQLKAEFDKDNGVGFYEVEFKKDGKEYDAKYRADNFELVEWDVEIDD